MRWSIRSQILIPLIGIQAIAVTSITLATATLAARRSERQIIDRLNGVIDTLGHANFPYTGGVLSRMRGLSGAHFVAYAQNGQVTETSFASLNEPPPPLRSLPLASRIDALGDAPAVLLGGTRYFVVALQSPPPRGGTLLVLYPETSWRHARWEAAMWPLILGIASLACMTAVTGLIAQSISRRLGRVEQRVAQIAGGDFRELDPGSRQDEIQDLARSINRMCAQLRDMRQTIRQSERTSLLAQLAAGLAHQLRNALTGARMSVQLHVKRCSAAGPDQSLDVALRQLTMTEEQVKGLLSLGRVERRPPVSCDLNRLLADVALLVHPSCQHARVTLREPRADEPIALVADEPSVRAAVLNLALNAIEAAGPGGVVGLELQPDDEAVAIAVSDTGPGPPPELAATLLEPFASSKPEGVGLGLTLAHQVALDHGGQLSWSRSHGETRFLLKLPRAGKMAKVAV